MKFSKFLLTSFITDSKNLSEGKKLIFPHQKERNPNYAKFPVKQKCDFKPDIDDACKDLMAECEKKYVSFACPTTCETCL